MPNYVPGYGSSSAQLVIVGEAPGAREDETGIPFSGPAGNLLNQALSAEIKPLQAAFRSKQESLQHEVSGLANPNLSPNDVTALKEKLIQEKKALITEASELRQHSEGKQNEALINIYEKLDNTIATFNRSRNQQFKLILKKSYVLYVKDSLNITSNIQHDFDDKYAG